MSTDLIKYGFVAGELAPAFYGRTDLTKYDLAMAEAYNFFVDYRGGLSSRPGFEFVNYIPDYVEGYDTLELIPPPLMFNYVFDPDPDFNFIGVMCPINNAGATTFSHSIIRFVTNGAYVTEAAVAISAITLANPAVITVTAHGFTTGDWITFSSSRSMNYEWRNRTVEVEVINANTFNARSLTDGALIDSTAFAAYVGAQTCARILTLTCDYEPAEYASVNFEQYRDLIRITHPAHPIRNLIRSNNPLDGVSDAAGNVWRIDDEVIGSSAVGPTITSTSSSAIPDGGSAAEVIFAVTSVYSDGSESARGPLKRLTGIVNYAATEGSVSINWAPDADALYYNVYRSIISVSEVLSSGSEVGFVGQTRGTKFTDPNIIPDFTRTPPERVNPFAVQPIAQVKVTAGGAGYTDFGTTAGTTGAGSGFTGEAVVSGGAVVNVIVTNSGAGYPVGDDQAGIITFAGGGASATATATVHETLGTYPSVSCIFQQRQLYAASYDLPTTLWGSQVKQFSNFDVTPNLIDSDSFNFTLDTPSFAAIRHLVPTQGGLLVATQESIWILNGGGPNEPITPTNAGAIPQTHNGISLLKPIKIGSDLLYAEGKGHAVRLLAYNEISRVYSGDDRSILSNHLFGLDKEIRSWTYQETPFKVVWAARSDGELLAFTIVKSEDIFAWTPCGTRGQFLTVGSLRENNAIASVAQVINDRIYVVTQRYLQGRWRRMIERMGLRGFVNVEDAYAVDCGLSLPAIYKIGNLNLWLDGAVWYAETDTGSLTGVTLPAVLRCDGGIFTVTAINGAVMTLEEREPLKQLIHETGSGFDDGSTGSRGNPIRGGRWSLDNPVTVVTGLWHLEAETVSILGDGNVFPPWVVTNGQVILPEPVTRCHIGLPFTARAKTLPITVQGAVVEGRRKIVNAIAVRLDRSRGLQSGRALDELYEMRERANEIPGQPTRLVNGVMHQIISTNWDENGQTYFVQTDPLPVTLLSVITEVEVGDDPN